MDFLLIEERDYPRVIETFRSSGTEWMMEDLLYIMKKGSKSSSDTSVLNTSNRTGRFRARRYCT